MKLNKDNERMKSLEAELAKANERIKTLEGALRFYRDEWVGDSDVTADGLGSIGIEPSEKLFNDKGEIARQELNNKSDVGSDATE